jgi:hypothetical protein
MMNRPASAYFNSNNNNVMNQSPSNPNIPSTQSTSTGNLMQPNPMVGFNQMPQQAPPHTHISHPNLSGNVASPGPAHRPPMLPNKVMQPPQQPQGNFMRESQSQHSLRMNQQQQMMAPSMPNIAHASGYANNIPASQSMQNMNQMPGNYPMYHPPQQQMQQQFVEPQQFQPQQLSPSNQQHHQASLLRGSAKMAEMGELLKRQQQHQQRTQQQQQQQMVNGGPMHFANSMDNIHIPQMTAQNALQQNFHPQSPQKQLPPTTAPKPQVKNTKKKRKSNENDLLNLEELNLSFKDFYESFLLS